ncbi:MAG: pyridoxal-5'-phosphate-dependent protein subunit beta [Spirochaetae bacterium HGW-Spirochaetae-9]|nr:MAG: pyridoxal-5'-phosphate-dependent protein subunit beta [Spirochaetae bacterium HGW-Spirochaetae-9]
MRWLYHCQSCGRVYAIEPGRYLCDVCGAGNKPGMPLEGVLECIWEKEAGDPPSGIPLPVESEFFPPLPVGDTPLWQPSRLREALGAPNLYLKDDTCNPSGSYKDRASWLVAAFACKYGLNEIALASTGNAASSMACVGAAAGLKITVFLPASAPAAKRVQVLQYGAELREVQGNYDQAFDESLAYSKATGVLSRNTAYNPLTIEGKKTASFEIARDLGNAPDHVFVPTGDGVILAGLIKGFEDLLKLGLTIKMPTFWAAQAEGSSAIARAIASGRFEERPSDTIADSISVDVPRNGSFVLAKLRKYGGKGVTVTDEEILAAQRRLSSMSGLFAEPSSACAFACYMKVQPTIPREESVVLMLTGSGLKDIRNAAKAVNARL